MLKKVYTVYVLHCTSDKYYVGVTSNLKQRYLQHCRGNGASYTRKYKPINIFDQIEIGDMEYEEACKYEDARTLELIKAIGIKHVRGGNYFRAKTEKRILRKDYYLLDQCYKNISNKVPVKPKKIRQKGRKGSPWKKQESIAKRQLHNANRHLF